jgi:hypothetical protein
MDMIKTQNAPFSKLLRIFRRTETVKVTGVKSVFSANARDYGTLSAPWLPLLLRLLPRKHLFPLRGRFRIRSFVRPLPLLPA